MFKNWHFISWNKPISLYLWITWNRGRFFDLVKYKKNQIRRLQALSQIFLLCQSISVESERIFSKSGEMITKKRNSLSDSISEALMCLNSWLRYFKSNIVKLKIFSVFYIWSGPVWIFFGQDRTVNSTTTYPSMYVIADLTLPQDRFAPWNFLFYF